MSFIDNNIIPILSGATNLTGALNLTTKLDPSYINTSTGSLSSTVMGYLVNITSDVQTQLNAKQSILWDYNTGTSPNEYYLSPSSNLSLNIVRNDTLNASYIEMGNKTNLTDTYTDFEGNENIPSER